jgi:perosamine synthetase
MTDVQAAVGLAQLRRLPHLLARRRAIAATYAARLAGLPLLLPASPPGYGHIFYRYVLRTDDPGRLRHRLAHRGVEAKPPVGEPLHRYTGEVACPQAEVVARTALSVPLYPSLSDGEVDHVAAAVADAVRAPEDTAWPRPLLVSGSR